MQNNAKKTNLWEKHKELGAKISEFSGYEMPLWYSSAKDEHLAVLTTAGIFDTSHMSPIRISGSRAEELLQFSFSRDLRYCLNNNTSPLKPGKSVYGVILNYIGHVIDDAILSKIDQNNFLLMVNADMGGTISEYLNNNQKYLSAEAKVEDLTDLIGKIDLQGPSSAYILKKVLKDPERCFNSLNYFSFQGDFEQKGDRAQEVKLHGHLPVMLSRSGYTGEFGFELLVGVQNTKELWEMLMQAGEEYGLEPCGLASRDSLRAGAVLPLSHQDIGDWPFLNNPWTFALPYTSDKTGFTKQFNGSRALEQTGQADYTYPFVGYDPRKITPGGDASVLYQGENIGTVLTCTTDMGIGWHQNRIYSIASPDKPVDFKPRGLCCGFIKVNRQIASNQEIELRDSKRGIKVLIAENIRPDRTAKKPLFPEGLQG